MENIWGYKKGYKQLILDITWKLGISVLYKCKISTDIYTFIFTSLFVTNFYLSYYYLTLVTFSFLHCFLPFHSLRYWFFRTIEESFAREGDLWRLKECGRRLKCGKRSFYHPLGRKFLSRSFSSNSHVHHELLKDSQFCMSWDWILDSQLLEGIQKWWQESTLVKQGEIFKG